MLTKIFSHYILTLQFLFQVSKENKILRLYPHVSLSIFIISLDVKIININRIF